MHIWEIGEENTIEYTLPLGFDEAGSDWVGIYKVNKFDLHIHKPFSTYNNSKMYKNQTVFVGKL